jgi:hypothetical protein
MLIKVKTIQGWKVESLDGDIGKFSQFYFDDRFWAVRYLEVDTGHWLPGRQVLISPYALGPISREEQSLAIALTRQQIEDSPALSSGQPVSKAFEVSYFEHYGWPAYWEGPEPWGASPHLLRDPGQWLEATVSSQGLELSLRSTDAVTGFNLEATDGEIGHVEDFIIDDETWEVCYLVIATRNWWPGRKVLISTKWIERVDWSERRVVVAISRESIKNAPEYWEADLVTRDYETRLHRHYDRLGYWDDVPIALEPFPLK